MASQVSCSGTRPMALPEKFTRMTFLPASCKALSSRRCTSGSSMLVRSPPEKPGTWTGISSPSRRGEIPPAKTTTSTPSSCFRTAASSSAGRKAFRRSRSSWAYSLISSMPIAYCFAIASNCSSVMSRTPAKRPLGSGMNCASRMPQPRKDTRAGTRSCIAFSSVTVVLGTGL